MIFDGYFLGVFKDNIFVMDKEEKRLSFKASENLVSFIGNLFKIYEPIKLEVFDNVVRKIIF